MTQPGATVLLVAGTARSGSTLLDAMLGNHPGGFACGEVVNQLRPSRPHHLAIRCSCGDPHCAIWARLARVPPRRFHRTVHDELGASIISDSSKDDRWIAASYRWARRSGLRAVTVAIWKDPRELAWSFWGRTGELEQWRRHFLGYYGGLLELGIPFVAVQLRALVSDPPLVLDRTLAAAGLSYSPGQERFWETTRHQCFGSSSIRRAPGEPTELSYPEPPEEFLTDWDASGLGSDPEVNQMVAELERRIPHTAAEIRVLDTYRPPLVPPTWYLKKRVNDVIRTTRLRATTLRDTA